MDPKLEQLVSLIDIKFNDPALLAQSLVHRSYINENRAKKISSNERMEFLGDAVLELWASENLYRLFPDFEEGQLTNIRSLTVCTQNLAKIANEIGLGEYLLLSKGEKNHGGAENISILADTFESLTGAIYLDQGYPSAEKFLNKFVKPCITKIAKLDNLKDPKSYFQEIAQAKEGITPHYETISETGPDHQKNFSIGVYLEEKLIATGTGNSKQKAEESAATKATKIFQNKV
jgi:ribonuclease III